MPAQRIQPEFLPLFDCKRGDCRRTCCRDWEVVLTAREFEAATGASAGCEAHALATGSLRTNPNSAGDSDSALCAMRPDGFCSLLTEDRLCGWKKLSGEGLCAACDDFPNTYISFLDNEYISPSLSCEAIVELFLTKADPIRLASGEISAKRDRYHASIDSAHFARRPLLELYPELMQWGLDLLEDRRFSLDDRMVLLANALSMIDWLERNHRVGEVCLAMQRFLQTENLEKTLGKFSHLSIGPRAVLTVCGNALSDLLDHSAYREKAREILEGLGFRVVESEQSDETERRLELADSEQYLKRKETMDGYLHKYIHMLEHIMVCQYLRSMMPVAAGSVWENFQFFNVCYAMLKGVVAGSFVSAPQDAELIDAIVVLHRMFLHDYDSRTRTLESLKSMGHADLVSMVALAKG